MREAAVLLGRRWVELVVLTLLGVAGAAVGIYVSTPVYRASAEVFVSTAGGQDAVQSLHASTYAVTRIASYAELARSGVVLERVIDDLGLDQSPAQLASQIEAAGLPESLLVEIHASSASAEQARDVANSVADNLELVIESGLESFGGDISSLVQVSTVREAPLPVAPRYPDYPTLLALGGFAGFLMALGAVLLRESLDDRIRTDRDLRAVTELPVIGAVPHDPGGSRRPLVVDTHPSSSRAEAYRGLRTNLRFVDVEVRSRAVSLTSSVQGEGKTTTAVNLALSIAQEGRRVLLIDADLRRPRVAERLGLEGAVGLTEVLLERSSLEDAVQTTGREGALTVLPAGSIPPNPSELLSSDRMRRLLERVERDFDDVLIDAPPVLPVTDAALLSTITGGTLLVVSLRRVSPSQVRRSLEALATVDANVLGLVLNRVPAKRGNRYGYYAREAYSR